MSTTSTLICHQNYNAFILTKMNDAASAWLFWLSITSITRMELFRNRTLRIATGQLVSTSIEALWMEANMQSNTTISHKVTSSRLKKNIFVVQQTTLNASLLIPTSHNGFLLLPAGKEKQLSYPIYFLTPSTNVKDLICLLPLHGTYQALINTTSYVLFQEYLANQMTLTLKLPRT